MKILKIKKQNLNKIIQETVKSIKNGQVVICPTDTVYGLICDATNKKSVNKLFKIKRRPAKKAIPVFVKDIKMAKKLASIDKTQEAFLKKIWPGKTTVVLKSKNQTIGLRVPKYKLINQLLLITKIPLTGTSANISGKPASTKIKDILKQFKGQKHQPDLVLDAGNLKKSEPSIVIDITVWPPKILRS